MEFGELLAQYRRRRGLTQTELASAMQSYSPSVISRLERGQRLPRHRASLEALGQALSLTDMELDRFLMAAGFAPTGAARDEEKLDLVLGQVSELRQFLQSSTTPMSDHPVIHPIIEAIRTSLSVSEYVQRASSQIVNKRQIADWIVAHELNPGLKIALDSGSTMVQLAHRIDYHHLNVDAIFTNNFIAALILMAKGYTVNLAGGVVNTASVLNSYGAILGEWAERACDDFKADITCIGVSGMTVEDGPLAPTDDDQKWKRQMIRATMRSNNRLIIAADYSKLISARSWDKYVLDREDWEMTRNRVTLVTSGEPRGGERLAKWNDMLKIFSQYMRVIRADVGETLGSVPGSV